MDKSENISYWMAKTIKEDSKSPVGLFGYTDTDKINIIPIITFYNGKESMHSSGITLGWGIWYFKLAWY